MNRTSNIYFLQAIILLHKVKLYIQNLSITFDREVLILFWRHQSDLNR